LIVLLRFQGTNRGQFARGKLSFGLDPAYVIIGLTLCLYTPTHANTFIYFALRGIGYLLPMDFTCSKSPDHDGKYHVKANGV
jgi:hypothetical protein